MHTPVEYKGHPECRSLKGSGAPGLDVKQPVWGCVAMVGYFLCLSERGLPQQEEVCMSGHLHTALNANVCALSQ